MQKAGRMFYRGSISASLLIIVLLSLMTGCTRTLAQPTPTLSGTLNLRAPAAIAAGQPVTLVVERSDAPDGMIVTLVTEGSYGPLLSRAPFQAGRAEFQIPATDTQVAGFVTLVAHAADAEGRAELTISPGQPVDPVTPLVGPHSVIADGAHWGSVVAIPFDAFGNPVAEGTPLQFRIRRPDGSLETFSASVTHLLAWRRISSSTHAGRTTISVTAGNAHGPDANQIETPGWPGPFSLSASPSDLPADGRQFVTLRTDPITDVYGNQMLDGTLITFVAETPGGRPRLIPAYTIDGVAEAQLQAPSEPGSVTVRATLYGVESAALLIVFVPGLALGAIPVTVSIDQTSGTISIAVGPLLAALGQFVPNGTLAQITLIGPDGATYQREAETIGGLARLTLRRSELVSGDYQIRVHIGTGVGQTNFSVP